MKKPNKRNQVKGVVDEIRAFVAGEIRAWDKKDPETLVNIFHPGIAWPWPPNEHARDPAT